MYSSSHLLTLGLVHYRVSTFATIVEHTFLSSVIDSSRPCSLMSLLILPIHLMRGLTLGLFPGISISSTVLGMSSGFLRFMFIPTESPFGNLVYNWHNVQSLSNLLTPYMVFQTMMMMSSSYVFLVMCSLEFREVSITEIISYITRSFPGKVGCHLDRHENIGRGQIGLDGFQRILNSTTSRLCWKHQSLITQRMFARCTPSSKYECSINVVAAASFLCGIWDHCAGKKTQIGKYLFIHSCLYC